MFRCSQCQKAILPKATMTSCPKCGAYLDPESVKEAVRTDRWQMGAGCGIVLFFLCLCVGIGTNAAGVGIMAGIALAVLAALAFRYIGAGV